MSSTDNCCAQCSDFIQSLLVASNQAAFKIDQLFNSSSGVDQRLKMRRVACPHETHQDSLDWLAASYTDAVSLEVQAIANAIIDILKPDEKMIVPFHTLVLFIEDFNAHALRSPSGHNICIIKNRIIEVLPLINYAIADYVIESKESSAGSLAKLDIRVFIEGLRLMTEYRADHAILDLIDEHFFQDHAKMMVVQNLGIAQLAFILCHEIAHHVLGHTANIVRQHIFGFSGPKVDVLSHDQREELDADELGLILYRRYIISSMSSDQKEVSDFLMPAPVLFMVYLECVENMLCAHRGFQDAVTSTHPPTIYRRKQLLSYMKGDFSAADIDLLKGLDYFLFTCLPKATGEKVLPLLEEMILPEDHY